MQSQWSLAQDPFSRYLSINLHNCKTSLSNLGYAELKLQFAHITPEV